MHSFIYTKENFFDYNKASSEFTSLTHYHDNYEIYYMIEGHRRYFIGNNIYNVNTGDLILIPEQTIHKVTKTPDFVPGDTHQRYLLSPSGSMIPKEFKHCFERHHYSLSPAQQEEITKYFKEIEFEFNNPHYYSNHLNHANLIKILCIVATHNKVENAPNDLSDNDILIEKISSYISTHFYEQLPLDEIAKRYNFSASHFSVLFKKLTGFNYVEYLTNIRIANALDMLKNTDLPITLISTSCGYNDSNYFASVFKKSVGTTPLKYREMFRKQQKSKK